MGCGERWPRVTSMNRAVSPANRARRPVAVGFCRSWNLPTDRMSSLDDRTLTMALSRVLRETGNEVIHSPWQATGVASLCRKPQTPVDLGSEEIERVGGRLSGRPSSCVLYNHPRAAQDFRTSWA
jgi:hypothetical protein